MASQISYLVELTLLVAVIPSPAQIAHTIEVAPPPPYVLPRTVVSSLKTEARCPGNVPGVPIHFVNRYQMIVTVSVNHSGPYNFLLDTGTQFTVVDSSLSVGLHVNVQGSIPIAGVGSRQTASFAQVDLLEAGSQAIASQRVLMYDLHNLYLADGHIQGILGEDFLEHFDMLIDNVHRVLCLNDSAVLRASVKGPHIPLVSPTAANDGVALPGLVVVAARLSDGTRPVRLMLDSGANGAILFNTPEYLAPPQRGYLQGTGVDGRQLIFSALPPQDVRIGSLELTGVRFFSLAGTQKDSRAKGFDGVLTTGLFRRVFICRSDHFVVLEPR